MWNPPRTNLSLLKSLVHPTWNFWADFSPSRVKMGTPQPDFARLEPNPSNQHQELPIKRDSNDIRQLNVPSSPRLANHLANVCDGFYMFLITFKSHSSNSMHFPGKPFSSAATVHQESNSATDGHLIVPTELIRWHGCESRPREWLGPYVMPVFVSTNAVIRCSTLLNNIWGNMAKIQKVLYLGDLEGDDNELYLNDIPWSQLSMVSSAKVRARYDISYSQRPVARWSKGPQWNKKDQKISTPICDPSDLMKIHETCHSPKHIPAEVIPIRSAVLHPWPASSVQRCVICDVTM